MARTDRLIILINASMGDHETPIAALGKVPNSFASAGVEL